MQYIIIRKRVRLVMHIDSYSREAFKWGRTCEFTVVWTLWREMWHYGYLNSFNLCRGSGVFLLGEGTVLLELRMAHSNKVLALVKLCRFDETIRTFK